MSASSFFSKSAVRASLWMSAIAGSLVGASMMFSAVPSQDSQVMGLDEFNYAAPEYAVPEVETNPTADAAATIALALVGGAALGLGVNAAKKRQGVQSANQPALKAAFGQSQTTSSFHQANRSLRRKLLLLLHEDQQAAERLVQQASFRYPGKSADWYLEKVIYDLQRDRGRI